MISTWYGTFISINDNKFLDKKLQNSSILNHYNIYRGICNYDFDT